ncbi:MAG: beta-propeller fold lactonase family protein [Rhodovarius sp.]|nr:beta-propeller fold lactonase family protein [Rhodovarius sp.]
MWRWLCVLFLLALPAARADLVYVLNSGEASISVLDARDRQELRRIPVLREPHHLVLTPDGRQLVVGDSGGNELLFIDPASAEVLRRERLSNPYHLEYSPDGRYLVIASLRRDQIDIYDAASLGLIARFRQPEKPSHIAFSPDSRMAYVTIQASGTVAAVDLDRREIAWTVPVGPEPAGIIWHRGRLLIGLMGSTDFVQLDPATRELRPAFRVGRGAHVVMPSPDGRFLYATARVDSGLWQIDAESFAVLRRYEVPGGPDCIAFDPDGRLWVTLRWIGRVAIIDPASGQVEQIRVGRSPHGIFVMPRREGMRPDFLATHPGAVSGSRPLLRPVALRAGEPPPGAPPPILGGPALAAAPALSRRVRPADPPLSGSHAPARGEPGS